MKIDWAALDRAHAYWYSTNVSSVPLYAAWLLEENGIDQSMTYIKIVDEKKYCWFLLRWS
jgi:hypothetical protein